MSKKEQINQETSKETSPTGAGTPGAGNGATDKASPQDAGQAAEAPEQTTEMAAAEEKIKDLEQQLAESNDKFLRLFSEFDNFRKRSMKERIELTKTASADIITALLPVLDDLERASKLAAEKKEKDASDEGVQLIYNKFKTILTQKGVEEIKTIGETFDTDYHDAITHIPATEEGQKGKVVDEVQKGYILNEKVIRFARVVVAN
jgi:molecular chaperone GrpE